MTDLHYQRAHIGINPGIVNDFTDSDFKISQTFENNTGHDVTVIFRNNFHVTFAKKLNEPYKKDFIIRTLYTFNSNMRIREILTSLKEYIDHINNPDPDITLIYTALQTNYRADNLLRHNVICIEQRVTQEMLDCTPQFYIAERDVMIERGRHNRGVYHPFSAVTESYRLFHNEFNERRPDGLFIELIDNEHTLTPRHIALGNAIHELRPRVDSSRESGVYINRYENLHNGLKLTNEVHRLTDDLPGVGIYKTREEALTAGDPEQLIQLKKLEQDERLHDLKHTSKMEELERSREIAELKHTLTQFESSHKQKDLLIQEQIEALKLENAKQKEESELRQRELERAAMERKDYYDDIGKKRSHYYEEVDHYRRDRYEERSYQRKDSSETLKVIGILASGALALFALSRK